MYVKGPLEKIYFPNSPIANMTLANPINFVNSFTDPSGYTDEENNPSVTSPETKQSQEDATPTNGTKVQQIGTKTPVAAASVNGGGALMIQIPEGMDVDGVKMSRKECILHGNGCGFQVANNSSAKSKKPYYELDSQSDVVKYTPEIKKVASIVGVDPNLIKSIMYMETTHGYYDKMISWGNFNKSILPMNINIDYWKTGFGTRDDLSNPYHNILAGATMIKLIQNNIVGPYNVAQVATLYQNINATKVSDYGARVEAIYDEKPW